MNGGQVENTPQVEDRVEHLESERANNAPTNDEQYREILMQLLDEAKREFDKWPTWMKRYSITARRY